MINIRIIILSYRIFSINSIIKIIFNHCNLIIVIFVKIIKIQIISILQRYFTHLANVYNAT